MLNVVVFITGKAVSTLSECIKKFGKNHNFNLLHSFKLESADYIDFEKVKEADVIIIQNTWGSQHPDRLNYLVNRQAAVNLYNEKFANIAKENNIILIVLESSTLSRFFLNYTEYDRTILPAFYRMAKDHWIYGLAKWCQPLETYNRIEIYEKLLFDRKNISINLKRNHSWKQKNELHSILVLPGFEHDPTNNFDIDPWMKLTIEKIRNVTNRKIIIKPHPLSTFNFADFAEFYPDVQVIDNKITLQELYSTINVAVIDNSTSIFELTEAGIPCFTGEDSFGAELGNIDVANIENPNLVDDISYYNWLKKMSYTEFTIQEYSHEYMLIHLTELVNS